MMASIHHLCSWSRQTSVPALHHLRSWSRQTPGARNHELSALTRLNELWKGPTAHSSLDDFSYSSFQIVTICYSSSASSKSASRLAKAMSVKLLESSTRLRWVTQLISTPLERLSAT